MLEIDEEDNHPVIKENSSYSGSALELTQGAKVILLGVEI